MSFISRLFFSFSQHAIHPRVIIRDADVPRVSSLDRGEVSGTPAIRSFISTGCFITFIGLLKILMDPWIERERRAESI